MTMFVYRKKLDIFHGHVCSLLRYKDKLFVSMLVHCYRYDLFMTIIMFVHCYREKLFKAIFVYCYFVHWYREKISVTIFYPEKLSITTAPITWASDRLSDDRGHMSTVVFRCRSQAGRTPDLCL